MFSGNYSWNGDIFTKDLSNGTTSKTNDKGTMKIIKINDTFYDVEFIENNTKIIRYGDFKLNKIS